MLQISRKKQNPLKNAARLKRIVAVFARHGFQNLAERVKLGKFLLKHFATESLEKFSTEERLRMCFEELGPTYVKFGQVLATRPDLIPKSFYK